jgi:hypothetical protein
LLGLGLLGPRLNRLVVRLGLLGPRPVEPAGPGWWFDSGGLLGPRPVGPVAGGWLLVDSGSSWVYGRLAVGPVIVWTRATGSAAGLDWWLDSGSWVHGWIRPVVGTLLLRSAIAPHLGKKYGKPGAKRPGRETGRETGERPGRPGKDQGGRHHKPGAPGKTRGPGATSPEVKKQMEQNRLRIWAANIGTKYWL